MQSVVVQRAFMLVPAVVFWRLLGGLCAADPPAAPAPLASPVPLASGQSPNALTGLQAFTILQSAGMLRGTGAAQQVTPRSQIKVDQFLTLLARATTLGGAAPLNSPAPRAAASPAWYDESLRTATSRELLSGLSVDPTGTLTREEAAVIIVRTAQTARALQLGFIPNDLPDLIDADLIDRKYRRYVLIAITSQLLPAYPDGYFRPRQKISWGEAAQATLKINQGPSGSR